MKDDLVPRKFLMIFLIGTNLVILLYLLLKFLNLISF
jgi:hypothetical protein